MKPADATDVRIFGAIQELEERQVPITEQTVAAKSGAAMGRVREILALWKSDPAQAPEAVGEVPEPPAAPAPKARKRKAVAKPAGKTAISQPESAPSTSAVSTNTAEYKGDQQPEGEWAQPLDLTAIDTLALHADALRSLAEDVTPPMQQVSGRELVAAQHQAVPTPSIPDQTAPMGPSERETELEKQLAVAKAVEAELRQQVADLKGIIQALTEARVR